MNESLLRETEAFLHAQIPLTQAMGARLEAWDEQRLVVTAPLEPNHNHLGTAFGGSLSAIATLTGYSLLWLLLGDRSAHIVVRESSIRYRRPVTGDIRAIGHRPPDEQLTAFREQYEKTGKARLTIPVTVEEAEQVCVDFTGEFVAIL